MQHVALFYYWCLPLTRYTEVHRVRYIQADHIVRYIHADHSKIGVETSDDMIWHDMTWYDMIWYYMTWYDMIRVISVIWPYLMVLWHDMSDVTCCDHNMVWWRWYDMLRPSYDMIYGILHDTTTIWHDMAWYDMILFISIANFTYAKKKICLQKKIPRIIHMHFWRIMTRYDAIWSINCNAALEINTCIAAAVGWVGEGHPCSCGHCAKIYNVPRMPRQKKKKLLAKKTSKFFAPQTPLLMAFGAGS